MRRSYWMQGMLAAAALAVATPAMSQSIRIDRDGIRVVPQQDMRDRERYERRRDRDRYEVRDGISEREAVRIADRVVVLSPRPARIVADIPVPLPHPRTDAMAHDPAFERLVDTVADALARSRRPAPEAGARP